jgi:uncharacterized protein YjhX (UPF0386 family)
MKRFCTIIAVSLMSLLNSVSWAQTTSKMSEKDFKKEIEAVRVNMNKEHSVIRFKKEVFQDEKTNQSVESSTGVIYRGSGINYRMVNEGITVLHLSNLILIIDSTSKMIQLSEPDSVTKTTDLLGDLSLEMLKNYAIEKNSFPTYVVYKATPKTMQESTLEFFVDTKTKRLYKLKMTLPEANYFSESMEDETFEKPYVVMVYEPVQELKEENENDLFSYTTYVKLNTSKKFELTEAFSTYELHDARYQPTNE